ncbi:MAG: hypothetical protein R2754_18670 [Microthrixaceae bacterium]
MNVRRLPLAVVALALVLAAAIVPFAHEAGAQGGPPPTPADGLTWSPALGQGSVLNPAGTYNVAVATGGSGTRKVELVAERSPLGTADWSHPSNRQPYFSQIVVTSGATASFTIAPGSFQAGYQYRLRARQWFDGDGANTSAFSAWSAIVGAAPGAKPIAPYPLSPKGQLGQSGIILRTDDSALPGSGGAPVNSYVYEIKTAHDPFQPADTETRWTAVGPAAATGVAEMPVTDCQAIPGCTGNGVFPDNPGVQFRWRVRSTDTSGGVSEWSRWRYFDTANRQAEYSFIPNRAGSYFAGPDGGDEMSGLVASRQYPGIYWGIRDAGGNEDRAALYAMRIGDDGRLGNVDGYVTKEIPVSGAENIDWESIVADDSGNLWIGDTGDYYRDDTPGLPPEAAAGQFHDRNNTAAPDVRLFRVPEPNPEVADTATVTKTAYFSYPDGRTYDAEAMFWLDGYIFLVTKTAPQQVFRFPGYLSGSQANLLRPVGTLGTALDPVTDATVTNDNTALALSTDSKRVVVYSGQPTNAASSRDSKYIVRDLLVEQDPTWHYYYRDAAAFEADGTLAQERPDPGPGGQLQQTTMQVEGVAFQPGSNRLAMVSEFGKHVLSVPATSQYRNYGWMQRVGDQGPIGGGGTAGSVPAPGTLVAMGSTWKFRDSGVRPSGFEGQSFNDSTWAAGPAKLGAGDGNEATTTNLSNPVHMTDYFRHRFTVTNPSVAAFDLDMVVDDGAVVYINGVEVVRHNMGSGPVTNLTAASTSIWGAAETQVHQYRIANDGLLHAGENLISVEVHQKDLGSSDVGFDLSLTEAATVSAT